MDKLENLKPNCQVKGILPNDTVTILSTQWYGSNIVNVTFRGTNGILGSELVFRDRENDLEIIAPGTVRSFDADPELFRLVSEAYRIRMAYLFDPWLAVHLSRVEPLPHQITAVYGEMLPRQPLRFLLADDPGSGKTIMTGLFIKELFLRGDLQRCLIVTPGNLTEQWQDELWQKFQLPFEIMTNDKLEAARTGNAFLETPLVIARLDKLSRDETIQTKLSQTDWDLVVVDEAHKMSASVFGGEIKYTKRYKLGQLLSARTRHLLLLTATPHNGKEEDFQLFMGLLDPDRFEGRYREGVHNIDVSDMMRRLVKEQLLKFDGTPLFPERRAYTVNYNLSDQEAALYEAVTKYVSEEFNRADTLETNRKGTVGFALTMLQRRLASSPEAIYQSLKRRRERLESRLREERLLKRGKEAQFDFAENIPVLDSESIEDLEDAPDDEQEQDTEQLIDLATASRTIQELELEIDELKRLEKMADQVRRSGNDRKWHELSLILQENDKMFDSDKHRRKIVIFTEHRDTLNYLADKIRNLLGRSEAVVTIHGGMLREERRKVQNAFIQDKDVLILVATDAAGEGINLQRAHLMVNYDLPWNPARIEQRFGRIHRIGQTEVCHLWNLVAAETREGDVYARLLEKIEEQRRVLGDGIFDILGKLFRETSLRDLLLEAIRYGDRPDVRDQLNHAVDNLVDRKHCQELLEDRALARDSMDITQVQQIRQDFERAEARRLQPYFIETFFIAAFKHLGGNIYPRKDRQYEISYVPSIIRNRSFETGRGTLLNRYERITFYKEESNQPGKPLAEFLCPGHPLMDTVIDLILERYRSLLKQGAILIDQADSSELPRLLFYLEESICDGSEEAGGKRHVVARQMQFIEISKDGEKTFAGPAPFLNYAPFPQEMRSLIEPILNEDWLKYNWEEIAVSYAIQNIIPQMVRETKEQRDELLTKTLAAVHDRLIKEISYWDHRAQELKAQEQSGKPNARLNSELAKRRADELETRLNNRCKELEQARCLSPQPPLLLGVALILPAGLVSRLQGQKTSTVDLFSKQKKAVEEAAMQAVFEKERELGFLPMDVHLENMGWDIESAIPDSGKLRFIEVKGRIFGEETITVSKNEILAGLNKPEDYFLVIVEVVFEGEIAKAKDIHYVSRPFRREPDFAVTSVNYKIKELLKQEKE
ncbi:MAG TPA: helicase-related protein [Flexilinea sp.]|nr:helicase-related protein [Flexilinea sp.]HQF79957.1 helicase-related protein [Flexilinea sp.]HQG88138.1 helicase-related protein [Flexilinea sp.]HQJ00863.1 helicase-related protein [Flexilinea sp.]